MLPLNFGALRQMEIYQGARPSVPIGLAALEQKAREALDPASWDYVMGSAGGERTTAANLAAFDRWPIVPRMQRDVGTRNLSIELFGAKLPAPIILGPVGVQSIIHPEGEVPAARAAASIGIPFVLSTVSSRSIEQVAEASGPRWFQLYPSRVAELNASMLHRAEAAGYSAIVATLDTRLMGWRDRDLERAFLPFLRAEGLANYFTDPVFRAALAAPPERDPASAVRHWAGLYSNPAATWEDIRALRACTRLPFLVKGVLHPDDARRALDCGADGVIVSNHGGRQVDGAIAALDALPVVADALAGRVLVLFDSGIRRGADVLKALALGAAVVLIGRLYCLGLAAGGEAGVRDTVLNLLADFDVTMALSGYSRCNQLDRSALSVANAAEA
jgi:isopentenyl diphosphate isomerase/L-lactate dehydrogenase-like FMN-dependent dehydrogenase